MEQPRRCTAKTAASGYKERCKKPPIKGGTVCQTHGGGAPQVQKSARERLDSLVEPALTALSRVLERVDKNPGIELHPSIVKVAGMVLDRSGYKPIDQVQLLGLENAKVTLVQEHGAEMARAFRAFASLLGHDPDSPPVRKAARGAIEGLDREWDDRKDHWYHSATPAERKFVARIMEAAIKRRTGEEVESLVAPEAGNGHKKRPVPRGDAAEDPDEVTL